MERDNTVKGQMLQYAAEQWGAFPEYLWANSPDSAVLRRQDTGKWFAVLMTVARNKLGLPDEGSVCILVVKCEPILKGALLDRSGFLTAYHMNKENWITILLDGSVSWEEILPILELSYDLTGKKTRT